MTHAARRRWYRFIETVGSMVFLRIRADENVTVHPVLTANSYFPRCVYASLIDVAALHNKFIVLRICRYANLNLIYKLITRRRRRIYMFEFRVWENEKLKYANQFYTEHLLCISEKNNSAVSQIFFRYIAISRGPYFTLDLFCFSR